MSEFKNIAEFLQPLTVNCTESLSLSDDVAIISHTKSHDLVVTKDTIVEGVHFLKSTNANLISRKLLGVNLSDIASAGATPKYYLIAASLPKNIGKNWWKNFSDELKLIQKEYNIQLIGGDTTSYTGDIILSATLIAEVPKGQALLRSNAQIGDAIFVSGTIGDAYLGLHNRENNFLFNRYNIPQPRIELGKKLLKISSCATDISDGLVADLRNICTASNVGAQIYIDKIPTSNAAKKIATPITEIITGGDDYELIFTVKNSKYDEVTKISKELELQITKIGNVTAGNNVKVFTDNNSNTPIKLGKYGYEH